MKNHWSLFVVFLLNISSLDSYAQVPRTIETRVLKVFDGDTFLVRQDGRDLHVRVHAMDCPERGQPYWKQAQIRTSDLLIGQIVSLNVVAEDRYGRPVADVRTSSGKRLSEELVGSGLCWWYEHYAPEDTTLKRLERKARDERAGLWRDTKPVPPWSFRYLERKRAFDKGSGEHRRGTDKE